MSKMVAVLTGDIVNSAGSSKERLWLKRLKQIFKVLEETGLLASKQSWDIFQGDSFQLEVKEVQQSMKVALLLRAGLKTMPEFHEKNMDVRISIGIAAVSYQASTVKESDGPAYQYSGRALPQMAEENIKLHFKSESKDLNDEMLVSIALLEIILSSWTAASAEVVWHLLLKENLSQADLARELNISQPAVNKRIARAHLEEILLLIERFQKRVTILQLQD